MKRVLDVVLSLAALVMLWPLLLLVGLCIVVETGWPVIFFQNRMGVGGVPFEMYKFRSMVRNAANIGPYFTNKNDARITLVGRFIRRTSIDELPQILNVLKGDMSIVGPRPDVAVQRGLYSDAEWTLRCSVRPGITGLAQVELRSTGTDAERLDLDLQYVVEHSFLMDVLIMWRTLGRLSGKGAN